MRLMTNYTAIYKEQMVHQYMHEACLIYNTIPYYNTISELLQAYTHL